MHTVTAACQSLAIFSLILLTFIVQAPRDAKQQIEDAMMAVMEKRHAMDDAAHGQSSNAV